MKFIFLLVLIGFDFSEKYIALTFDDGPCSNGNDLLDALFAANVKATFFLIGENAANFPGQVQRAVTEGHEIGCHGWNYDGQPSAENITRGQDAISSAGGGTCKLFRAPNLDYDGSIMQDCNDLNLTLIGAEWNVVGEDWDQGANTPTTSQVAQKILNGAHEGAIILLHWPNTAPQTVAAIPTIVSELKAKGYEFVTISQLANLKMVTLGAGQRFDSFSCNKLAITPTECGKLSTCKWINSGTPSCYLNCDAKRCLDCDHFDTCGVRTDCVWDGSAGLCKDDPNAKDDDDSARLSASPHLLVMAIAFLIGAFLAGVYA